VIMSQDGDVIKLPEKPSSSTPTAPIVSVVPTETLSTSEAPASSTSSSSSSPSGAAAVPNKAAPTAEEVAKKKARDAKLALATKAESERIAQTKKKKAEEDALAREKIAKEQANAALKRQEEMRRNMQVQQTPAAPGPTPAAQTTATRAARPNFAAIAAGTAKAPRPVERVQRKAPSRPGKPRARGPRSTALTSRSSTSGGGSAGASGGARASKSRSGDKVTFNTDALTAIFKALVAADALDPQESEKPLRALPGTKTFELQSAGGGRGNRRGGRDRGQIQRGQQVPGASRDKFNPRTAKGHPSGGSRDSQRGGGGGRHHGGGGGDSWARGQAVPKNKDQVAGGGGVDYAKPLHQSENAYTIEKNQATEREVVTQRALRSILNKLARETLSKLSKKLLAIEIQSKAEFELIVEEIFDIALRQPFLCDLYAELCACIAENQDIFVDQIVNLKQKEDGAWWYDVGVLSTDTDGPTDHGPYETEEEAKAKAKKKTAFKRMLLLKTQKEFERKVDLNAFENAIEWDSLTDEDKAKKKIECARQSRDAKKRMLGNIKFIGELFRQRMLSPKIMHHCLTTLLKEMTHPDEAYIECCCNLLKSIGKLIDTKSGKEYIKAYFERLEILGKHSELSTRVRFMCQDICETRRNRWNARHAEQRTMTKDEVRAAAAREEAEKQRGGRRGGRRDDRRGGDRRGGGGDRRDDRRNGGDVRRRGGDDRSSRGGNRHGGGGGRSDDRRGGGDVRYQQRAKQQQQQQASSSKTSSAAKSSATTSSSGNGPNLSSPDAIQATTRSVRNDIEEFTEMDMVGEFIANLDARKWKSHAFIVEQIFRFAASTAPRDERIREKLATLIVEVTFAKKFTKADIEGGVRGFCATLSDDIIDIPLSHRHFGQIVGMMLGCQAAPKRNVYIDVPTVSLQFMYEQMEEHLTGPAARREKISFWADLFQHLEKKLAAHKPNALSVQAFASLLAGDTRDWSLPLSGEGSAFDEFCKAKVVGSSSYPMAVELAPKLSVAIAAAAETGSCDAVLALIADNATAIEGVSSEFARVVAGQIVAACGDDSGKVAACAPIMSAAVGSDAAAKAAAADKAGAMSSHLGLL
jgi:hypothetical protein